MEIKVTLDESATMPTKAHASDAGYDLYMPNKIGILKAKSNLTIDTGVHMLIPDGYVGMIKSKSGLNVKYGIRAEGVIDAGYTGSIVVKLYNDSNDEHIFESGDKLTQLVIIPIPETQLVQVESFDTETDRGENGFGSTGR